MIHETHLKFEGPEKKIEVILSKPMGELRSNKKGRWERISHLCNARILSKISTPCMDAYLLSESSLFVWDDRILIITCGKTTPVPAVSEIINIVGIENISFLFYERKNFMFPSDQPSDFEYDVARLLKRMPGKSYRLGPANYDHVHIFFSSRTKNLPEKDVTLQVLMHDLDDRVMRLFYSKKNQSKNQIEKETGLENLYPDMVKDSHVFSPFGYSMNGILKNKYVTIHVTPQPTGSYASFETNVFEIDYSSIIRNVLSVFCPERFSIVLTTGLDFHHLALKSSAGDKMPGYKILEKSFYEFESGYAVKFINHISDGINNVGQYRH